MTDSDKTGLLDYKLEGFNVSWSEHGLDIRTIDYQVGCLHLSWETILGLAQRAGVSQVSEKKNN